ncbi:MAG: hypothetical protein NC320_09070 [Clostridium sp.]|nr:hypothetical protein [Clostridium sp.]MCM1547922.1 hypothetical protein [Ruminococcus sp.]
MITIEDICAECKNYFVSEKVFGVFTISAGIVSPLDFVRDGQYFRILGSVFNDGVYRNTPESLKELQDETFDGAVWAMNVPKKVQELVKEINEWQEKYGEVSASPYASESFGGYSYSKASAYSQTGGGGSSDWRTAFRSNLNRWRKLREY